MYPALPRTPTISSLPPTPPPTDIKESYDPTTSVALRIIGAACSGAGDPHALPRNPNITIVDTETTGLGEFFTSDPEKGGLNRAGILEVALRTFDPTGDLLLDQHQELVNSDLPISTGAFMVHGITAESIASKRTIDKVLPDLFQKLEGSVIVGHNLYFDIKTIELELQAATVSDVVKKTFFDVIQNQPRICTLRLAGYTFTNKFPKINVESYALETLCRQLDLEMEVAHRAMADVKGTHSLLKHLQRRLGCSIKDIIELQSRPVLLDAMPRGRNRGIKFSTLSMMFLLHTSRFMLRESKLLATTTFEGDILFSICHELIKRNPLMVCIVPKWLTASDNRLTNLAVITYKKLNEMNVINMNSQYDHFNHLLSQNESSHLSSREDAQRWLDEIVLSEAKPALSLGSKELLY